MSINIRNDWRKILLQKDFEEMKKNIQKVEVDLILMKANMNVSMVQYNKLKIVK